MIRVEHYVDDDDETILDTQFHGFQIYLDGLSASELFELDRRSVRKAIDRYISHRERLYTDPPTELNGTGVWLIHGLGRLPADTLWGEFHVYFLLARLRFLLSENPQPVTCSETVDPEVSDALASLCKEFNVEFYPRFQQTNKPNPSQTIHSFLAALGDRILHLTKTTLAYLRPYLIFVLFMFVRPVILKLYDVTREPVDVRFWLHPVEDHMTRLYDVPTDLASREFQVGYALYDAVAMSSLTNFIWRGFKTILRALDPDQPVPVEWYINPTDFREAIKKAPCLVKEIQDLGSQAQEQATTPEFTYLARQLETVSFRIVLQILLYERAIEGFSVDVNDEIWCHARGLAKPTSRLLAIAGERVEITTVGVSPHYHSKTRVGYQFTDPDVNGPGTIALPDLYVVFEPQSATMLREQQLPSRIAVARDKIEAETYPNGDGNVIQNCLMTTAPLSVSPPDGSSTKVLVILTLPADNREIVESIEAITGDIPDIQFVFKPHPLIPHSDRLFDGLQDINFEVTSPDASLADLIGSCDICIAMYSSAAIPALARATPVVWVPLGSPNHVRMDLIAEVGIRADDPDHLAKALERLVQDETFYGEQARECARFAENNLVPMDDAPSLADLIEGAGRNL